MSLQEKPNDNGKTEQRTLDPALREIISAQREFFATGKTRDVAFRRGLLKNLFIIPLTSGNSGRPFTEIKLHLMIL